MYETRLNEIAQVFFPCQLDVSIDLTTEYQGVSSVNLMSYCQVCQGMVVCQPVVVHCILLWFTSCCHYNIEKSFGKRINFDCTRVLTDPIKV